MANVWDVADVMSEEDVTLLIEARGRWIARGAEQGLSTSGLTTPDDFARWADEVKLLASCLREMKEGTAKSK